MLILGSALINDTNALVAFFSCFVALIFAAARLPFFAKLYQYLPPIVWIYLLPVVFTTIGLTPSQHEFYDWCSGFLLPCALLLLTLSTDVKAIARLGPLAAAMLLCGTMGIVVGGPLALLIFQPLLDAEAWRGMGALSGSWIGGTSNMVAIKEGIGCPQEVLAPYIIVDSVVGYGWMSVLIALGSFQDRFDAWMGANRAILDDLNRRMAQYEKENRAHLSLGSFCAMLGVAFAGGWICMEAGRLIPELGSVLSHFTYGILLVVIVGLTLSLTPLRRLENEGASNVGYGAIYLLTATMGAGGDLKAVLDAPLLLLVGAVWISVQIAFLFAGARLLRAPMFLFATGSMGNVGGVVSTPVVASAYRRALAPVGILMGVLGNLVGTPAGLLCAQLLQLAASAHGVQTKS